MELTSSVSYVTKPVVQDKNQEYLLKDIKNTPILKFAQKNEKSWFKKWIDDEDKVSTDNKDDGKISFGEKVKSFTKGLFCSVKSIIKHPIATLATVGVAAGLITLSGGALAIPMIAAGATMGIIQIGLGSYKALTAKTDGKAKEAWENIGTGSFVTATSLLGAKTALKSGANAGVTSAETSKEINSVQALIKCYKSTPEATKVSAKNISNNVKAIINSILGKTLDASSVAAVKLNQEVQAMSKTEDVDATKVNFSKMDGYALRDLEKKYDLWIARENDKIGFFHKPGIDNCKYKKFFDWSQDQMIVKSADKTTIVPADLFKASYVDRALYKSGTISYLDPSKMQYGEQVKAVSHGLITFKEVPAGTQIQTINGLKTVSDGQVVTTNPLGQSDVISKAEFLQTHTPVASDVSKTVFSQIEKELDFGLKLKKGVDPIKLRYDLEKFVLENVSENPNKTASYVEEVIKSLKILDAQKDTMTGDKFYYMAEKFMYKPNKIVGLYQKYVDGTLPKSFYDGWSVMCDENLRKWGAGLPVFSRKGTSGTHYHHSSGSSSGSKLGHYMITGHWC